MDGFRKTPAEDRLENSTRLLEKLHTQRMARINKSMASLDLQETNSHQNHGQALSAESCTQSKLEETTAGPCPTVVDAVETIVILTYNVWFRKLELEARMNAIGQIIQLHQPHVICFQEVTSTIYSIFQRSSWWSLYKCSVTPTEASERSYYCLQLSKLSASAFYCHPYSNSIMKRELAIADLDCAPGHELVVATTHLESPCRDSMFSKERAFQANKALRFMKNWPNVVFGGDMNWDDGREGLPPLPQGWFDAWLEIHPDQPGLTFDSIANPMLRDRRLIQKRLDRFFCHLRDFKVESIEMVGTQPISGLTYENERTVRWGRVQRTMLPVLPSDHFGLLLKVKRVSA